MEKQSLSGSQITKSTLDIETRFRGLPVVRNRIVEVQEEDSDGHPLGFSKHTEIPNAERHVTGTIKNSTLSLRDRRGENESVLTLSVPDDFFLGESLRKRMQAAAINNKELIYSDWDFQQQAFRRLRLRFLANDDNWQVIENNADGTISKTRTRIVDKDFLPTQLGFILLGKSVLIIRCPDYCVDDAVSPMVPLDQQMIASPYTITDSALKGRIRYQIQLGPDLSPVATDEQYVVRTASGWTVDVCAQCDDMKGPPTVDLAPYLVANTWLEVNDPRLKAVVERATSSTDSPARKMEKLTSFTTAHLESNPQFSGYATALQALQNRTGDCTESALLLAALARTAGVPARVVFGFGYSREKFHGKKNMFAPHAWVQAWVDGGWRSYDAALLTFDAGHLALKLSDGNQRDFMALFDDFEQIKITALQQVVKKRDKSEK